MQRTVISEALAADAPRSDIRVCGWVRTRRDSKNFVFLELNDGSCLANLQCIIDEGYDFNVAVPKIITVRS